MTRVTHDSRSISAQGGAVSSLASVDVTRFLLVSLVSAVDRSFASCKAPETSISTGPAASRRCIREEGHRSIRRMFRELLRLEMDHSRTRRTAHDWRRCQWMDCRIRSDAPESSMTALNAALNSVPLGGTAAERRRGERRQHRRGPAGRWRQATPNEGLWPRGVPAASTLRCGLLRRASRRPIEGEAWMTAVLERKEQRRGQRARGSALLEVEKQPWATLYDLRITQYANPHNPG